MTRKKKQNFNRRVSWKEIKPLGHCASIFSLSDCTVVDGLYLCGPMSVPSDSLNLSSIKSWPAAIDEPSSKNPPQIRITLSKNQIEFHNRENQIKPRWNLVKIQTWNPEEQRARIPMKESSSIQKVCIELGVYTEKDPKSCYGNPKTVTAYKSMKSIQREKKTIQGEKRTAPFYCLM